RKSPRRTGARPVPKIPPRAYPSGATLGRRWATRREEARLNEPAAAHVGAGGGGPPAVSQRTRGRAEAPARPRAHRRGGGRPAGARAHPRAATRRGADGRAAAGARWRGGAALGGE